MNHKRGYFGIGIFDPKIFENIGILWRSAHNFKADFLFVIGQRYKKDRTDTSKAYRHIPLYEFRSFDDFQCHLPHDCQLVCVEQVKNAKNLKNFVHPERACYLLGAEDQGIPEKIIYGHKRVFIDTPICLNVAVAGSIVMYDRQIKSQCDKT